MNVQISFKVVIVTWNILKPKLKMQIHIQRLLTPCSHHATSIRLTVANIRQLWSNALQLRDEALIQAFLFQPCCITIVCLRHGVYTRLGK